MAVMTPIPPLTGTGAYTVPANKFAIINVILQGLALTAQARLKINGKLVAEDGNSVSSEDHPVVMNGIVLPSGSTASLEVTGGSSGGRALLTGFEYDV